MQKTKVKLLQKTYVSDGYGGSELVFNFIKEISGYFVGGTDEISAKDSKITVETTAKFVSDMPVSIRNAIVEYEGLYYNIEKVKPVYSKGSVRE